MESLPTAAASCCWSAGQAPSSPANFATHNSVTRRTMRLRLLFLALMIAGGGYGVVRLRTPAYTAAAEPVEISFADPAPAKIDFTNQVRPILARCQPCHFSGGKMYDQLPFDRPETVTKLGEKLFSRIQKEDERKIIREFLAQE